MNQDHKLPHHQGVTSAHLGSGKVSGVGNVLREAEAERRRLAELLNNEPVQALAHISRALQGVESMPGTPTVVTEAARDAGLQAAAVSQQLRRIARLLRPSVLDDIGLGAALRQLTSEFAAKSGLVIESDLKDVRLKRQPELDIALYRVAESALRNVEDGAATAVRVRLAQRGTRLVLTVRDNGSGCLANDHSETSATRFFEMAERMRAVQGQLKVRSRANCGTIVIASVPSTIALAT